MNNIGQPITSPVLMDFVMSLNRQTDYQEILRIVAARTKDLLNAESCLIMMINPSTGETIKTVQNEGGKLKSHGLVSAQAQITGWMLRERTPFMTANINQDKRFLRLVKVQTPFPVIAAALLQVENLVIGSLIVFRENKSAPFSENDKSVLEYIAATAAPYLRNIKKIKEFFSPLISQNVLVPKYASAGLIGQCERFIELLRAVEAAARCDVRVVLEGESGTGKELIARAIHQFSERNNNRFVAVDCGAMPTHLLESELFGHKKGAFTGAVQDRHGLIESAQGGTLFIDEITNLPLEMQTKLMRFLQEGEIRPLGSNTPKKVNVRIISASSRSLNEMVKDGTFRQDLYFRLHVYPIYVPDLSDREQDITLLANYFLKRFSVSQGKHIESIHPDLLVLLRQKEWNGNIRELENFIERLVSLTSAETTILSGELLTQDRKKLHVLKSEDPLKQNISLKDRLTTYEKHIIKQALIDSEWNQSAAARVLDMSEALIRFRMKKLGIAKHIPKE